VDYNQRIVSTGKPVGWNTLGGGKGGGGMRGEGFGEGHERAGTNILSYFVNLQVEKAS